MCVLRRGVQRAELEGLVQSLRVGDARGGRGGLQCMAAAGGEVEGAEKEGAKEGEKEVLAATLRALSVHSVSVDLVGLRVQELGGGSGNNEGIARNEYNEGMPVFEGDVKGNSSNGAREEDLLSNYLFRS